MFLFAIMLHVYIYIIFHSSSILVKSHVLKADILTFLLNVMYFRGSCGIDRVNHS